MLRHLARSWALGCAVAVAIGLGEAAFYLLTGRVEVGGARIFYSAAVIYLVIASFLAVPLGLAVGLVDRMSGGRFPASGARYGAVYGAVLLVMAAGFWLNVNVLGGALDPASLAVDAALALAGVPLATLLLLPLTRVLARRLAGPWRAARLPFWGAAALLALAPLLLSPDPTVGAPKPAKLAAADRPNVLFLLIDTLRADHLGCYGYSRDTSPFLDRLAAGGVLFENCVSAAPYTKPSTASILTSLYPPTHRMEQLDAGLAKEAETLHTVLHQAGYRTALLSANSFLSPTYGFGRGVERFRGALVNPSFKLMGARIVQRLRYIFVNSMHTWAAPWLVMRDVINLGFPDNEFQQGMTGSTLNRELLAWLDQIGGDRWFAYLQYMEPHDPYEPAAEHRLFDNPADPGVATHFPSDNSVVFLPHARGREISEEERQALINNYDGCIHEVDTRVRELLEELDLRGQLDDTLVVVTSDHGEEFYDHGGWGHGQSLHAELVQVPLILSWRDRLPAGARISAQVRTVDLMPTILEAAGVAIPAQCAGASLRPLWEGTGKEQREAFSQVHWRGHWASSLRLPDGKLIWSHMHGKDAVQLFDFADAREIADLAAGEAARAARLKAELESVKAKLQENALEAVTAEVDDALKGTLAELGYAEGEGAPGQEPPKTNDG